MQQQRTTTTGTAMRRSILHLASHPTLTLGLEALPKTGEFFF
jgi:hypothetical protein